MSMFYFCFRPSIFKGHDFKSFRELFEQSRQMKGIQYERITGASISLIVMGILFDLNNWPGAKLFPVGLILLLAIEFYKFNTKKERIRLWTIKRLLLFGTIGVLSIGRQ